MEAQHCFSTFGVNIEEAETIKETLKQVLVFEFLLTMHFIKHYPKYEKSALQWKVSRF